MIFDYERQTNNNTIIKVLGVGGGGSNAVTHMFKQNIVGVDFGICNTDAQALELSPVPTKIHLGPELTKGRGAGNKPETGRAAAEESIAEIQKYLSDDCQMLFVTAGMGGGTGTGAAPVVARVAKELGILTVGIVTLPFSFEGPKRIRFGVDGLLELKKHVDALVVVSNDKLRLIHAEMPIRLAFAHADNVLTTAARGIAEIITRPGYINVDFEDVNTVLRQSGVAIMGIGYADGEDRAQSAVDQALASPLLEDNKICGAQNILLNICSGKKDLTMDEIDRITQFVQTEAGEQANLIWGTAFDEALEDGIAVTVIATGFEESAIGALSGSKKPARTVIDLNAPKGRATHARPEAQPEPTRSAADATPPQVKRYNEAVEYRAQVLNDMNRDQAAREAPAPREPYRPAPAMGDATPPANLDDLASLEREPAFLRYRRLRSKQPSQAYPEQQPSRTVVDEHGEARLGAESPWLYEKPD